MTTSTGQLSTRLGAVAATTLLAALAFTGCDLTPHPGPDECRGFPRTGEVERTVVEAIDISRSAEDEWDELQDQALALATASVGEGQPAASIQVIAQDNTVMTHGTHVQLVEPIGFDFDTDGNGTQHQDYTTACLTRLEDELDDALDGLATSDGSDPFGAAAYAATTFAEAGTTDNVLGLFGDGYANNDSCNLYRDAALLDLSAHEDLARQCSGGILPSLADVAVYQSGVAVRSASSHPRPGDDDRARALIDFYRDTVWPLTGARQPASVGPRLEFGQSSP